MCSSHLHHIAAIWSDSINIHKMFIIFESSIVSGEHWMSLVEFSRPTINMLGKISTYMSWNLSKLECWMFYMDLLRCHFVILCSTMLCRKRKMYLLCLLMQHFTPIERWLQNMYYIKDENRLLYIHSHTHTQVFAVEMCVINKFYAIMFFCMHHDQNQFSRTSCQRNKWMKFA